VKPFRRRHISIRTIVAALFLAFTAHAEDAYAPGGESFPVFWQRFKDAVSRNSEPEVRELVRLPFRFEGAMHDAENFARVYAALFDASARECLAKTSPTAEQGMYMAFCGPTIFVFAREGETWKLTEFTADPEQ
jgi:hypothetical protein